MRSRQSPDAPTASILVLLLEAGSRRIPPLDSRAARLREPVQVKIRRPDALDRARTGLERQAGVPAARKSARRLQLDQRPALHVRGQHEENGAIPTCPATHGWGYDEMKPISKRPRTSSAAPPRLSRHRTGRCRCRTSAATRRSVVGGFRRRRCRDRDLDSIPISTAPRRRALDSSRLRRRGRPRSARAFSYMRAPKSCAAFCTSRPRRWRSNSVRGAARSRQSNTGRKAVGARARARKETLRLQRRVELAAIAAALGARPADQLKPARHRDRARRARRR